MKLRRSTLPARHLPTSLTAAALAADPVLVTAPIPPWGAVCGQSGRKSR
jgi:hypothetical protein